MAKIYDCFLYNDEDILLDLRYHILKDVVDKFVVIEMDKTFSGKNKPYCFDFTQYNQHDKFIRLRLNGRGINENSWDCEKRSRNSILSMPFEDDDIIILSDIDEIPNPEKIPQIGAYELNFYYYYFNGYKGKWIAPVCQRWSEWKRYTPQEWRLNKTGLPIIKDGGWHFSYVLPVQTISNKIRSFSHTELDRSEYTDVNKIYERILELKDPFDRINEVIQKVELDNTFPKYLLDNVSKYKGFIL